MANDKWWTGYNQGSSRYYLNHNVDASVPYARILRIPDYGIDDEGLLIQPERLGRASFNRLWGRQTFTITALPLMIWAVIGIVVLCWVWGKA